MTNQMNAIAGSLVVGDFVDEGDVPAEITLRQGEVVRPEFLINYVDVWSRPDDLREFTILDP